MNNATSEDKPQQESQAIAPPSEAVSGTVEKDALEVRQARSLAVAFLVTEIEKLMDGTTLNVDILRQHSYWIKIAIQCVAKAEQSIHLSGAEKKRALIEAFTFVLRKQNLDEQQLQNVEAILLVLPDLVDGVVKTANAFSSIAKESDAESSGSCFCFSRLFK